MRTILLSLAGALCFVVSAQAQMTVPLTPAQLKRVPPLDNDVFLPGIYVDMPLSEVRERAARAQWTLLEESSGAVRYQTEPIPTETTRFPFSFVYTVFVENGKVHGVSATMSGPIENEARLIWTYSVISATMENRASAVKTDRNRRIMTHTTSDGRTMRVIWTQVSTTQAEVEATVDFADEKFLPLK